MKLTDGMAETVLDAPETSCLASFAQGAPMIRPTRSVAILGVVVLAGAVGPALAGATTRVSVGPGGVQADDDSDSPAISADGRFVAFASFATNWIHGTGLLQVWIRDRQQVRTTLVSVGRGGPAVGGYPAISADGRYVAFYSGASNLAPPGRPLGEQVYVRDLRGGTTLASVGSGGALPNDNSYNGFGAPPSISADGRFVAFEPRATNLVPGDTNRAVDIFVRDRRLGTTSRVSVGPGGVQGDANSGYISHALGISADGRFVASESSASTLVSGDSKRYTDIYVRDRRQGVTSRVSVGPGGVEPNESSYDATISADGRLVAFRSFAGNLLPGDILTGHTEIFVRDRQLGVTSRASAGPRGVRGNGYSFEPVISGDGRFVGFRSLATNLVADDTNDAADIFVHAR